MNWRVRSLILRGFATLPFGRSAYRFLQGRFGAHLRPDHLKSRLRHVAWFARSVARHGIKLEGATVMEVGTGWYPVVPIGLWLCGAEQILTYDLNRYLLPQVMSRALEWMVNHQEELTDVWCDLASAEHIKEKLAVVERFRRRPFDLLEHANIRYVAPADAGASGLAQHSVDIHLSLFTFEHIPKDGLLAILREAARVLRPGGVAVHRVDPKDHFSSADPSITKVNFLRLTEREWRKCYDNWYAYQNRLHDPEFRALFEQAGLELLECGSKIDKRSLDALKKGFPLAPPFDKQDFEELCRCSLDYVATPRTVAMPATETESRAPPDAEVPRRGK